MGVPPPVQLMKKKKKVLFVTTVSGFLPQFESNDVKLLKEMGFEIHYASNFKNPIYAFDEEILKYLEIIPHQIDIAKSPVRVRMNVRAVSQIRKVIDENEIDMVHCHNPMGGAAARIAAGISKRKPYVIYTAHGFHFYKGADWRNWLLFYTAERFLARFTDQIITINREDYLRAGHFRLKKDGSVHQIHSVGVDEQRFMPRREIAAKKRRELFIPEDAFHIVTAAELNENKNQKIIIESLARLRNPKIHYSLCGKGPNEASLRELIAEKGLQEQVHILGYRTDMEEILQTADCFAFPSHREGLGVAAVEALLCGTPLVASDNRGTREYAVNGKNSIVCHADSVKEFAAAIDLLYKDKDKRSAMAQNCRASVEQFTIKEVEKTMRLLYWDAVYHMNAMEEEETDAG